MIRRIFWSIFTIMLACCTCAAADIRRVVTGLDANNKAIALFDSRLTLKPGGSGNPAANLWITDSSPPGFSFKDDSATKPLGLSPPDNGTAIRVVEFPPLDPTAEAKMDPNFMMKVVGDHAPARGIPVKHPLMHRTRTVDYAIIMSGEIDMMLDDTVVHVKAGDVVIQQATNHAWINRSTQPCRVLFVLMDSKQHDRCQVKSEVSTIADASAEQSLERPQLPRPASRHDGPLFAATAETTASSTGSAFDVGSASRSMARER